ncbi:MAG TPA: hypothetical protein PLW65_14365 [Pseudomonadota bacterium]|nr:hypothetical protein [Pseudomonadota bacterium]
MRKPVFRNFGGMYQLRLETAEEIRYIRELEKARWSATSAPLEQFYCDPQVLAYLDTDNNGRIRVHELLHAQQWLYENLASRDGFERGSDELSLASLDPKAADAPKMKQLAEHMLKELGLGSARSITLSQVRTFRSTYAGRFPNGDGVVPPEHADSPELAQFIKDIVAATGGSKDLGGSVGAGAAELASFLKSAQDALAWEAEGAVATDAETPVFPAAIPWGEATAAAAALIEELNDKVEQYFSQCDLLRVEPNAAARMQASAETLAGIDITSTEVLRKWTLSAPLAPPREDGLLDLSGRLNPNYEAQLHKLAAEVLPRALGLVDKQRVRISLLDWRKVRELFAAHRAWRARHPAIWPAHWPALSTAQLAAYVKGELAARLTSLITTDSAVGEELQQFHNLEKLILLQRWLKELLNNFVSFPALFNPARRALFIAGTMIIDGRELGFCVRVTDRAAHKRIAATSPIFIIYAELTRKSAEGESRMEVAAAITAGTRGQIVIGKRGVFYDRDGNEWDAVVVDLIVNPISLWEAAIAPFVRLRDFVGDKIEKFAASKTDAAESAARDSVNQKEAALLKADQAAKAPPKTPEPQNPANTTNLVVGLSLGFAAATSALALIFKAVIDTDPGKLLSGLLMIVLVIAGFSAFLGFLKLRRRDLSTVLEACGWAMNLRMKLRRRLARLFTRRPGLPRGSKTARVDWAAEEAAREGRSPSLLGRLLRVLAVLLMFAVGLVAAWKYDEIRDNGLIETIKTLPDALAARLR